MSRSSHDRAEVLAGAIALGEATDEERIEYRRHLAECGACLDSLGGEQEFARLSAAVTSARESEVWEPDVRGPLMDRVNGAPRRVFKYGIGLLGVCVIISLIGHFVVGSTLAHPGIRMVADPVVINFEGNKIVLERRSTRDARTPAPATAKPVMVVSHNVVTLRSPARSTQAAPKAETAKKEIAYAPPMEASRPATVPAAQSNVPPWRRGPQPVARNVGGVTAAGLGSAHAESLNIAPMYSTRDPEPLGGETSINPRPAAIAYSEGAEGTTAFEVMVDENGNPTKCVISKSSNWPVLDDAVCSAAMKVKYKPKTLNGHPVPGVYRDAFTFRPQAPEN